MYWYDKIWSQANCIKQGYALPKEKTKHDVDAYVRGEIIVVVDIHTLALAECPLANTDTF